MPNLSQIRALVRESTLVESDDFSNTNLDLYINQGLRVLSLRFDWPWLQTSAQISTTASTQAYAVPTDWRRTLKIVDNDKRRSLLPISEKQAFEVYGGDPPTAVPRMFYVYDGSIHLLPIPSSTESNALTHYYQKGVTVMTNDSDEPEFDDEFHLVLADYAIARLWEYEEDFAKRDTSMLAFDLGVEEMARHYINPIRREPATYGDGRRRAGARTNMPFLDDAS